MRPSAANRTFTGFPSPLKETTESVKLAGTDAEAGLEGAGQTSVVTSAAAARATQSRALPLDLCLSSPLMLSSSFICI